MGETARIKNIEKSLLNYYKTRLVPEREKLLAKAQKDINQANSQIRDLKHEVFSCPKEHELELNTKLKTLEEKGKNLISFTISNCQLKMKPMHKSLIMKHSFSNMQT